MVAAPRPVLVLQYHGSMCQCLAAVVQPSGVCIQGVLVVSDSHIMSACIVIFTSAWISRRHHGIHVINVSTNKSTTIQTWIFSIIFWFEPALSCLHCCLPLWSVPALPCCVLYLLCMLAFSSCSLAHCEGFSGGSVACCTWLLADWLFPGGLWFGYALHWAFACCSQCA